MTETQEPKQEEIIFKPKYPRRIMLTVYLYPFGVIIFALFIYLALASGRFIPYGLFALVFGFTITSMPMILFREVRFGEVITVKRYFFPARLIRYEEVTALTPRGLVARRGGIPLVNVENRREIEKIIRRLAARHVITLEK